MLQPRVRSRFSVIAMIALLVVIGGTIAWARLEPTIKPGDVYVIGILRPPGQGANISPDFAGQWTLEIDLGKVTKTPLYADDRPNGGWNFLVTPYVAGKPVGSWDFFKGVDTSGRPAGQNGYTIGSSSQHQRLIEEALASVGNSVDMPEGGYLYGFTYRGNEYPARIRFYLGGTGPPQVNQAAIVYSHYERRWGKDLSWSVAFPVRIEMAGP